ncbi:unnamed protein product [Prunus armeniaca]|uniref:Uncharacterized protein n=1 Tax=Prunus armeniaca TaxID=36596 RepID=A0A6J5VU25_PRUAR|nr:unnamed protein product [Prunus armeniaca]
MFQHLLLYEIVNTSNVEAIKALCREGASLKERASLKLFIISGGYAFPYYTQTSVEAVPEYVKLVMALSTSMESTAVDIQLLPNSDRIYESITNGWGSSADNNTSYYNGWGLVVGTTHPEATSSGCMNESGKGDYRG